MDSFDKNKVRKPISMREIQQMQEEILLNQFPDIDILKKEAQDREYELEKSYKINLLGTSEHVLIQNDNGDRIKCNMKEIINRTRNDSYHPKKKKEEEENDEDNSIDYSDDDYVDSDNI